MLPTNWSSPITGKIGRFSVHVGGRNSISGSREVTVTYLSSGNFDRRFTFYVPHQAVDYQTYIEYFLSDLVMIHEDNE